MNCRDDFFSSVIKLHSAIFSVKKKFESCCRTLSEQVKNELFERGCRLFHLFYYLTRIIHRNAIVIHKITVQDCMGFELALRGPKFNILYIINKHWVLCKTYIPD
jgi:hypothetical protein